MKNLDDNVLKTAFHLYAQNMSAEFLTDNEVADIVFSARFEKKMNRIINKRKSFLFKFYNTATKKAVSIAAIFIIVLTLSLSVKAIREPLIKMFKKIFETHVEIEFQGGTKDCISEIYAITEIPDGYTITDETSDENTICRYYENKNGTQFSYIQSTALNNAVLNIDNENSINYTERINNIEVNIADCEKYNTKLAYWIQDEYLFVLTFYGRLSDDEIAQMIKSNAITKQ